MALPPNQPDETTSDKIKLRKFQVPKSSVFAALAIFILLAVLLVYRQINQPLGPSLPTFSAVTGASGTGGLVTAGGGTVDADTLNDLSVKPVCGGPAEMTVLLIGADTHDDSYVRGLADFIRLVRVDFTKPEVRVLSIPRDLWVKIYGVSDYQGDRLRDYFGVPVMPDGELYDPPGYFGRINTAYFYGNLYELPGGGPGILAGTIYTNLGVMADHYAAINLDMTVEVIDAIGGIDVDVPYPIEEFSSGYQHMNGEAALNYARIRMPDTTWDRSDRQNIILMAAWEKINQPQTLKALPALINAFKTYVLTDFTPGQISSLLCLVGELEEEDIEFMSITPDMVITTDTTALSYVLVPDTDRLNALIQEFMGE